MSRSRCARPSGGCRCSAWSASTLVSLVGWAAGGRPPATRVIRETWALVRCKHGPIRFERHTILLTHVHFAWVPLGDPRDRALDAARDRLRHLPAARVAAVAARAGGPPARRRRRSPLRAGLALVLQAPSRQALLLQRGADRVRRLPRRGGRAGRSPATRSGPTRRFPELLVAVCARSPAPAA